MHLKLYPLPPDYEAFERLCLDLLRIEWGPTVKPHGRRGQSQYGVDFAGLRHDGQMLGAQAKFRGFGKQLSEREIKDEIKKAKTFTPLLDKYIILTSTRRDTSLQRIAWEIESDLRKNKDFGFEIWFWEDLCERISKSPHAAASLGHEPPPQAPLASASMSFQAGKRVARIRSDLTLSSSEFTEAFGFSSEGQLDRIESMSEECSLERLLAISEGCGASIDWLKHAKGPRYTVEDLTIYKTSDLTDKLSSIGTKRTTAILSSKDFSLDFISQSSPLRFHYINTNIQLDFWNWIDDHKWIPRFYKIIKDLSNGESLIKTNKITEQEYELLGSGQCYPGKFAFNHQRHDRNFEHFIDDITDFDCHKRLNCDHFYGPKFREIQNIFKQHLETPT